MPVENEEIQKTRRFEQLLFPAAFFLLLSAVILLTPQPDIPSLLRIKPEKSLLYNMLLNLEKFPVRYEESLNENLFLQDETLEGYYHLRVELLGDNAFSKVVIGKEGWLFYGIPRSLDDYHQNVLFSQDELDTAVSNLQNAQARLPQGTDFYVMIAPDKGSIYPEYLPDYIQPEGSLTRFDQLTARFAEDADLPPVLDMRPALLAGKEQQIYYKTDTHWNAAGAFLVCQEMLEVIHQKHAEIAPLDETAFSNSRQSYQGDLVKFIAAQDWFQDEKIVATPARVSFETSVQYAAGGEEITITQQQNAGGLPTLLVFHDSFYTEELKLYTSSSFGKVIYKHLNGTDSLTSLEDEIIAQYRPDIVIYEVVERNLPNLGIAW